MQRKQKTILEKIKKSKFICLTCLMLVFGCKNYSKKNISSNSLVDKENVIIENNKATIVFSIDDTIEANKNYKVGIKFFHKFDDLISNPTTNIKLLDGCLIFSKKENLMKNENQFNEKCDSIFFPKSKVNDSVKLFFNFSSRTLGEKKILLKLKERNFYNNHKDSIRMIDFDFFETKSFYVTPPLRKE